MDSKVDVDSSESSDTLTILEWERHDSLAGPFYVQVVRDVYSVAY